MDPATLSRAQRGEPSAQAAFLRELGPQVASLVRRVGERADVEDQVHEVFAHLLAVLPKFRPDGPAQLSTWSFTVAHRWLLMQRRRPRAQLVAIEGGLQVADPGRSPEEVASGRQLADQLDRALQKLSGEHRRVFVLTQLHHQPLEAVAEVEGVPIGTIKSRLHRARAELVLSMGPALDRPVTGGPHALAR